MTFTPDEIKKSELLLDNTYGTSKDLNNGKDLSVYNPIYHDELNELHKGDYLTCVIFICLSL